jgi:hypothetical protein
VGHPSPSAWTSRASAENLPATPSAYLIQRLRAELSEISRGGFATLSAQTLDAANVLSHRRRCDWSRHEIGLGRQQHDRSAGASRHTGARVKRSTVQSYAESDRSCPLGADEGKQLASKIACDLDQLQVNRGMLDLEAQDVAVFDECKFAVLEEMPPLYNYRS